MTQPGDQNNSNRRNVLKKLGTGAVALPLVTGAAMGDSGERDTLNHRRFEIWGADHLAFDYYFEAYGPVEPVTHPEQGRGAEPNGNDSIRHIGGNRYRVTGRTGEGYDDTWMVDNVYRVVIDDAEFP